MKNFKYTLIAVATTIGLGMNADVLEYDNYSMEEVSKIVNSKFETFIVKFKNEQTHKDLKRDIKNNQISENRVYGLSELNNISYGLDLIIKHDKTMSYGIDSLKIESNNLSKEEIEKKLKETGLFEFVEKEKTYQYTGSSNKKINKNSNLMKTSDLPLGRYNDPFWSIQFHFEDRVEPNMGLSNLLKSKDFVVDNVNRKIKIAVLDSGSFTHEDVVFSNKGYDFTTTTGQVDENGNSITKFTDDDPTDLGLNEDGTECISGHGLAVSGLINATSDNARGIVGALDTSLVDIIPVRVGGCAGISSSDLVMAINWVAGVKINGIPEIQENVDIINMSLAGEGECSTAEQLAINAAVEKGIIVVVAAGNDSSTADNVSPANCENVITVGSLSKKGDLSEFSNFGDKLSVSGIGENWVLPFVSIEEREGDQYGDWSGTSFSAPMVSAITATVRMKFPELNMSSLKELLERTANNPQISQKKEVAEGELETEETELVDAAACIEKGCGSGVVDAVNALVALDDRTKVSEGEIFHKYAGFNSLAEAKYLKSLDNTTGRKSCDLYIASWGLLRDEFDNITHRVYTSDTNQEVLTSANSNLQKIVNLPSTIIESTPDYRVGVQICEGSFCGEIFELELPEKDIPIYCESYISN